MSTVIKTIVATGVSSGLGFEVAKLILTDPKHHPCRFIFGARNVPAAQEAYAALDFDRSRHSLTILPLELNDLRSTRAFARETLKKLSEQEDAKIDYLLLNAAIVGTAGAGPHGSQWCEPYVVNHLAQHYLVHLLREKLVASKSRIVVVSSGAVRQVNDTTTLESTLKANAGTPAGEVYSQTKFIQLLSAHWWRRQLSGQCDVVAVSPGLIPGTGLSRSWDPALAAQMAKMPDAKSVPEGAASILAAFVRDDFPADPEQIFLTSWGEWWSKDVYGKTLDKQLQDKWSPSKETIESEEGL